MAEPDRVHEAHPEDQCCPEIIVWHIARTCIRDGAFDGFFNVVDPVNRFGTEAQKREIAPDCSAVICAQISNSQVKTAVYGMAVFCRKMLLRN
jgi:hypothetical protein